MAMRLAPTAMIAAILVLATPAAARTTYQQALLICQARAAETLLSSPGQILGHGRHGIIGFWVLQDQDWRREQAIVSGCLAEHGWITNGQ